MKRREGLFHEEMVGYKENEVGVKRSEVYEGLKKPLGDVTLVLADEQVTGIAEASRKPTTFLLARHLRQEALL